MVPPLVCHSNLGQCEDTASGFLGQCQHTDWIVSWWAILGQPSARPGVLMVASGGPTLASALHWLNPHRRFRAWLHIHLRGFLSSITAHVAAAVIPPSATSSKT